MSETNSSPEVDVNQVKVKKTRGEKIGYIAPGKQGHSYIASNGKRYFPENVYVKGLRDSVDHNDPSASNSPVKIIKPKDQS